MLTGEMRRALLFGEALEKIGASASPTACSSLRDQAAARLDQRLRPTGAGAFDTLLAPFAPEPRRYAVVAGKHGVTHYGPWRIYFDPPPIPARNCDWHFVHDDFDGAPDANDGRCGYCPSFADALNECDAMEDDE